MQHICTHSMETRRRNSNDVYLTLNLMKKMPINGVEQGKEKGGFIIIAETTCRIGHSSDKAGFQAIKSCILLSTLSYESL